MVMSQQQTTIGQQQQQPQADQQAANNKQQQQAGKARKRKSKQPQTNNQANNNNNQQQLQTNQYERTELNKLTNDDVRKPTDNLNNNGKENLPTQAKPLNSPNGKPNIAAVAAAAAAPLPTVVVPSERTTLKKQQQVSPIVKEPIVDIRGGGGGGGTVAARTAIVVPTTATPIGNNNTNNSSKHLQLANEEPDDIDAGIELDGSSNSGSSVKDIGEDNQIKSNSVSPVMAQSNMVNESCLVNAQPIAEVTPIEKQQLSQTTTACLVAPTPTKARKISTTTKQQLAANQQVIDADEQLLQEKLQLKQKKCLQQDVKSPENDSKLQTQAGDGTKKNSTPTGSDKVSSATVAAAAVAPPPLRRRFSSQSSQETQDGSLCKVCEQHVYQMERMMAEKSVYHKKCFRCHQCKIQLRVDNYSSHEGQVYCKAHHRQIFQPQVKLDTEDDVDIVAKSSK